MRNFTIQFAHPWLLLLFIPAIALTVFLYLRLNKKYRRSRNRIVSLILHSIVMTLCIFTLSGLTFNYQIGNAENELILLVDASDTMEETRQDKEDFIHTVLTESGYNDCRVGVVTFGFTQQNAVPFTYDFDAAFDVYLDAPAPDVVSGTDIAEALRFARSLFEHPETGKIVLISDGKETDESALSVIRSIASQGVLVDTVYFPDSYTDESVQVTGIGLPDYSVRVGENFQIEVTIESKTALTGIGVSITDNGVPIKTEESNEILVDLSVGEQTVVFTYAFREQGLHELHATVQYEADTLQQNNSYTTYRWLQIHNKVLILEQADQSERFTGVLEEDEVGYEITLGNVKTGENVPTTIDELRAYDQIILNNISSEDLENVAVTDSDPKKNGLDDLLYDYVYTYGGGLFTTGGMEEDGVTAHAYSRSDMHNKLYQQLLPVQAIKYTPPVAVIIIIDISGSMGSPDSPDSPLYFAKQGAIACLDALEKRDYLGVMTLDTNYGVVLDLTPCTQDGLIKEKILSIGSGQMTNYSNAIRRASAMLANQKDVDKRHIIIVSDGVPTEPTNAYLTEAKDAYEQHGITLSVVGIGVAEGDPTMTELVTTGHGRLIPTQTARDIVGALRNELNVPEIEEIRYGEFNPEVANPQSVLLNGVELTTASEGGRDKQIVGAPLTGFYGTKVRSEADVILVGEYNVPIYAQWKFGKGMVGSFMCDVYSDWSAEFMENESGKRFLQNVVANLMPIEDMTPTDLRIGLKEDNYINTINVYSTLQEGEYIDGTVTLQTERGEISIPLDAVSEDRSSGLYVTLALGSDNNYSRAIVIMQNSGVYTITVNKRNANGEVLDTTSVYKSFSYSEEYDYSAEEGIDPRSLMGQIAANGNGRTISVEEPWEIFSTFVTELDRVFDPRWLFMIIAMVLFLLDIAVRKFKFKWPHELIRDYKERRAGKS